MDRTGPRLDLPSVGVRKVQAARPAVHVVPNSHPVAGRAVGDLPRRWINRASPSELCGITVVAAAPLLAEIAFRGRAEPRAVCGRVFLEADQRPFAAAGLHGDGADGSAAAGAAVEVVVGAGVAADPDHIAVIDIRILNLGRRVCRMLVCRRRPVVDRRSGLAANQVHAKRAAGLNRKLELLHAEHLRIPAEARVVHRDGVAGLHAHRGEVALQRQHPAETRRALVDLREPLRLRCRRNPRKVEVGRDLLTVRGDVRGVAKLRDVARLIEVDGRRVRALDDVADFANSGRRLKLNRPAQIALVESDSRRDVGASVATKLAAGIDERAGHRRQYLLNDDCRLGVGRKRAVAAIPRLGSAARKRHALVADIRRRDE
ncbi:MAG: hypothetical protein BWX70_01752 [Verrucomicrobia bacterium ADurb.Bin070]|nr:MAG: hypothetical protein BWX70_01752 [Verrucomicrobia bacterium ADurb.Bin070]